MSLSICHCECYVHLKRSLWAPYALDYSCTQGTRGDSKVFIGSTKIIHRYPPRDVNELFVYYVWIVRPFVQELNLLVPSAKHVSSSFLWLDGDRCGTVDVCPMTSRARQRHTSRRQEQYQFTVMSLSPSLVAFSTVEGLSEITTWVTGV